VGDDTAANNAYGVIARKTAAATETFYLFDLFFTDNLGRIFRAVAAVYTSLAADTTPTINVTTQYTTHIRCVGSSIITRLDGVQQHSVTDSNIDGISVGGSAVGIRGDGPLGLGNWGDFEADIIESVFHRASISGTGNTTTSVTLVIPASTVANDVVYAAFTNGGATADPSVADNEGAGTWAKVLSGNNGTSNLSVWWKRASVNTAGKTITGSGFTNSCTGVATVVGGAVLTGNPYGGETYESNISGNETHAAITPTVNGSMVCLVVGQAPDIAIATQAATSPAVLIERAEHLSTGGLDSSVALASEVQVTAGSTGALTWAQTNAATMSIAFYVPPEVAVAADPKQPYPWQSKGQFAVHMAH
jgi:hypothetical protein